MADLNKLLAEAKTVGGRLETTVRNLLVAYEELYREAHNQFVSERIASNGNMEGLEEFQRLVNIVHRNRDVIGAIQRGLKSFRPLESFKFVEEDAAEERAQKRQKAKQAKSIERRKKRAEQQAQAELAPSLDELIQGPPKKPEENSAEGVEE